MTRVSAHAVEEAARLGFHRSQPGRAWSGIDVIVGGPPCQGFSVGGRRNPNDERNVQLLTFVKLVVALRPRAFCLENVAGLLEPRFDDLRQRALKLFRNAGYAVTGMEGWVSAHDFGVPQKRKRVILLGVLGGPPAPPLALVGKRSTVRDAFEGLPDPASYSALLASDFARLKDLDLERFRAIVGPYARLLAGHDRGDLRGRPRIWDDTILTNSLRTAHSPETVERFDATTPGSVEPKSRLYRLPLDDVARTLRAGTGSERGAHTSPRPIHPKVPRVITVREAARLHGYPDWFRFHSTNWHGHRQIGNSVPPPLAKAAAMSLRTALGVRSGYLRSAIELGDPLWLRLSRLEALPLVGGNLDQIPAARGRRLPQKVP
jgi:DNA (cytosine-5)-methyltransferase 1